MKAKTIRVTQYVVLAVLGGIMAWWFLAFLKAVQPTSNMPARTIDQSLRRSLEQDLEKADSGTILRSISDDLKDLEKTYDFRATVDAESLQAPDLGKELTTP